MKKILGLFLGVLLLFNLSGCDVWDDWFGSDDDDSETVDITTTETTDDSTTTETKSKSGAKALRYSHYNPAAWHGTGSAIVLCTNSPTMDSCKIGGKALTLHGSKDKGRQVYTNYYKKGLSGTVVCVKGSKKYKTKVSGSGLQYGSCN